MQKILASLFGGSCYLCRGEADDLLCQACSADLPRLPAALCPRCALAAPMAAVCGRCLARAPQFDATVAALAYDFPADALLLALKFRGELALAPLLSALLADKLSGNIGQVDCVMPVPLALSRLRSRGYNQAAEIARPLAARLGVRLDLALCQRGRDTPPQAELPWAERGANVRGAFDCARSIEGATVAVVDDIMTTGATLEEIAGTLKRAGAARVVNWVVARTLPPD
jgi:ComF family protein